jgi:hypothetical protein
MAGWRIEMPSSTDFGIKCFEVVYDHSRVKTPDQSKMRKITSLGVIFPDGEVYIQACALHFHRFQEMKDFLESQGNILELKGDGIGEHRSI